MNGTKLTKLLFDDGIEARIDKIIHIGSGYENRDFEEFIDDLSDSDFYRMFPEVADVVFSPEYEGDFTDYYDVFLWKNKVGFIVVLKFPYYFNFKFDTDGKPTYWGYTYARQTYQYLYMDDFSKLEEQIKEAKETMLQYFIKMDKKHNV